jgi:hypothetical protein
MKTAKKPLKKPTNKLLWEAQVSALGDINANLDRIATALELRNDVGVEVHDEAMVPIAEAQGINEPLRGFGLDDNPHNEADEELYGSHRKV